LASDHTFYFTVSGNRCPATYVWKSTLVNWGVNGKHAVIVFDLDGDVATTFGDEFRKSHDSVMSLLTHVNHQS